MTKRIASFQGTALSEADIESGRVLSVRAQLRADYAWDAGLAIGRYLDGLKAGHILGVRCRRCGVRTGAWSGARRRRWRRPGADAK